MSNRTTTLTSTVFASTVFATVLAGTGLMSAGSAPARAADDCLSAPKHETSAGGHWYYRVDRQSQRKCWYLADQGHKTGPLAAAKPVASTKTNSQRAAERIPLTNADARAELPALTYTDQPDVSAKPGVEPLPDAPLRSAPEEPVLPPGNVLLNSAAAGDSEPATTNAVQDAATDAAPEALPTAAGHEPAISPFRLTLSLLLVMMGLGAVMAAVVFKKRSDPVPARRDDVAFHMRDPAGEPEEAFEERTSLALNQDIPLFLVRGRLGPDQRAVTDQNYELR
jgi:hypothetical protein